jgi:hypothetical protein
MIEGTAISGTHTDVNNHQKYQYLKSESVQSNLKKKVNHLYGFSYIDLLNENTIMFVKLYYSI